MSRDVLCTCSVDGNDPNCPVGAEVGYHDLGVSVGESLEKANAANTDITLVYNGADFIAIKQSKDGFGKTCPCAVFNACDPDTGGLVKMLLPLLDKQAKRALAPFVDTWSEDGTEIVVTVRVQIKGLK